MALLATALYVQIDLFLIGYCLGSLITRVISIKLSLLVHYIVPLQADCQTYHLSRDRRIIQDIMHNTAKLADYDAICTFVFPDYLSLAKFMYDKDGADLNNDHENFMDDSQMRMMVGDEYVLIDGGEKVK